MSLPTCSRSSRSAKEKAVAAMKALADADAKLEQKALEKAHELRAARKRKTWPAQGILERRPSELDSSKNEVLVKWKGFHW